MNATLLIQSEYDYSKYEESSDGGIKKYKTFLGNAKLKNYLDALGVLIKLKGKVEELGWAYSRLMVTAFIDCEHSPENRDALILKYSSEIIDKL